MKRAFSESELKKAKENLAAEGVSPEEFFERAGKALAKSVLEAAKEKKLSDVLFVCGGGESGGFGFCAANELLGKIDVHLLCLCETFSPECSPIRLRYQGEILRRIPRRRYRLIVDCLGTDNQIPEETFKSLVELITNSGAYVISCGSPAGLKEGGICLKSRVRADQTLSIGAIKQSLLLADGADVAGEIAVGGICISPEGGAEIWEREDVAAYFPVRKSHVHKGDFGTCAILANVCEYPNAPLFSAGAALRSGAGYTKLYALEPLFSSAIGKNAAMLCRFRNLESVLGADAIALGMGAGSTKELHEEISKLCQNYEGVLILDADALNVCAQYGYEFFRQKKCRVILTPHLGEFSRLVKRSVDEILPQSVSLAQAFAKEYGVVLVLKNNRTVISDGVRVAINVTGSAALSKGGSGDILSGFLAGTCARGVDPFEASCVSAYLCGRAGEIASFQKSEYAATADDVIESLPEAIKSLRGAQKAHAD